MGGRTSFVILTTSLNTGSLYLVLKRPSRKIPLEQHWTLPLMISYLKLNLIVAKLKYFIEKKNVKPKDSPSKFCGITGVKIIGSLMKMFPNLR